jgi:hypothetical protein
MNDQLGLECEPCSLQCLPISGESLGIGLIPELIADVGDPSVTQVNEMLSGHAAGCDIVNHDRMDEFTGMLIVDEDNGNLHLAQMADVERADARSRHQNSIHTPLMERMDDLDLSVRIRIGIGQEDGVAMVIGHFLDATDDLSDERISNRGDNDANSLRLASDQTACDSTRPIAHLFSNLANALSRLPTDKRAIPQRP